MHCEYSLCENTPCYEELDKNTESLKPQRILLCASLVITNNLIDYLLPIVSYIKIEVQCVSWCFPYSSKYYIFKSIFCQLR
jgi:hypothetical protein